MEDTPCVTTVTFVHNNATCECPESRQSLSQGAMLPETCKVKVIELLGEELGFHIWPSSLALGMYLVHNPGIVRGLNVLELGSGTGLVGLIAAALRARKVTLTDSAACHALVNNLVYCIQENPKLSESCELEAMALTWGEFTPSVLGMSGIDVVLAADCLYQESGDDSIDGHVPQYDAFMATLRYLCDRSMDAGIRAPIVLLAHQARSKGGRIQALVKKWGFDVQGPLPYHFPCLQVHTKGASQALDTQGSISVYKLSA